MTFSIYQQKIISFFQYLQDNNINKKYVEYFLTFINTELINEYQPIVNFEQNIVKYESLLRFKVQPINTKGFTQLETLLFLSEFASLDMNIETNKIVVDYLTITLEIDKKIIEEVLMEIAQYIFMLNIKNAFKFLPQMQHHIINQNDIILTPKNNNISVSINVGKFELLVLPNLFLTKLTKYEQRNFKKYINLELLEYYIEELDVYNIEDIMRNKEKVNGNTLSKEEKLNIIFDLFKNKIPYFKTRKEEKKWFKNKKQFLLKSLFFINKMSIKIALDDYTQTKFLINRIKNLVCVLDKKFTTIKIDKHIMQKIFLMIKIINFAVSYLDGKNLEILAINFLHNNKTLFSSPIFQRMITKYDVFSNILPYDKSQLLKTKEEICKEYQIDDLFTTQSNNLNTLPTLWILMENARIEAITGMLELTRIIATNLNHIDDERFEEEYQNLNIIHLIQQGKLSNEEIVELVTEKLKECQLAIRKDARELVFEYVENQELNNFINYLTFLNSKYHTEKIDKTKILAQGYFFSKSIRFNEYRAK